VLSELSQSQKDEYYMITHFYEESRMITFIETESGMVVPRDTGGRVRGQRRYLEEVFFKGLEFPFGKRKTSGGG